MELWKENSVFCSVWKSQKWEPRGVYRVSVCVWALRCITQGMDPWLPARLWMELWQLVKIILERTVGCEDKSAWVLRQEKVLAANKVTKGGSCGGLITAEIPWTGWTCRYVGSYLTLPLISYFLLWSQSFNASLSTAPLLAFGFRPGINEYPKPCVIWLLQIY